MDQTNTVVLDSHFIDLTRMAYSLLHLLLLLLLMMMIMVMSHYNKILVSISRFPVNERSLFTMQYRGIKGIKHYLAVNFFPYFRNIYGKKYCSKFNRKINAANQ